MTSIFCNFIVPETAPTSAEIILLVKQCLLNISAIPQLHGLFVLFGCILEVFSSFLQFVDVGYIMKEQLGRAIVMFGHGWNGIIMTASFRGLKYPLAEIQRLEDLLANHLRYFSRYTGRECHCYDLVENDQSARVRELHTELVRKMSDILDKMSIEQTEFFTFPTISLNRLRMSCNSLQLLRLRFSSSSVARKALGEKFKEMADKQGITNEEQVVILRKQFLDGLDARKASLENMCDIINDSFTTTPIHQIMHPAMNLFWKKLFGPKKSLVAVSVFLKTLEDSLKRIVWLDAFIRTGILNVFKLKLGQDPTDTVDFLEVAQLMRSVPRDEIDLAHALTAMASNIDGRHLCSIPPVSRSREIFFDPWQLEGLIELMELPGWKGISGPSLSGKTTRMLFALHSKLPTCPERDFLWIDFDRIHSETDGCARLASQLFLRRCNKQEEIFDEFKNTLQLLRPKSVVVFDNIRIGLPSWTTFLEKLFSICDEYQEICFVVISDNFDQFFSSFTKTVEFATITKISMMSPETALRMATHFHPITKCNGNFAVVDPCALVTASYGLSRQMASYASSLSLGTLRTLATDVVASEGSPEKLKAARIKALKAVFCSLSRDERALACCLLPNTAFFDEGLSWAMSSDIFNNEIVRWKLAWCTLLDVGWIVYNPELGYFVSPFASLLQFRIGSISSQQLFDAYMLHYATELGRMNSLAEENPAFLEWFSARLPHFSALLQCLFFNQSSTKRPKKPKKYSPTAELLVGVYTETLQSQAAWGSDAGVGVGVGGGATAAINSTVSFGSSLVEENEKFICDSVQDNFYAYSVTPDVRSECLVLLVGKIGRVLSYHLSPSSGIAVARSIVNDIAAAWDAKKDVFTARKKETVTPNFKGHANIVPGLKSTSSDQNPEETVDPDDWNFDEEAGADLEIMISTAKIDLAEQCLRQGSIDEGIELCTTVTDSLPDVESSLKPVPLQKSKVFYKLLTERRKQELGLYSRVSIVYGRLLMAKERPTDALLQFNNAKKVFQNLQCDKEHWETALITRLIEEAKAQISLQDAINVNQQEEAGKSKGFGGIFAVGRKSGTSSLESKKK